MAKKSSPDLNTIDLVLAHMRRQMGDKGTLFKLDSIPESSNIEVVPTGIYTLDEALGVWGIPKGKVLELWGKESSGKTSLALLLAAAMQKADPDRAVIYIDTENSLDPNYAVDIGVDTSRMIVSQPNSAEEALDLLVLSAQCGDASLIVLDSVAALTPQAEIDGTMGDQQMGLVARLMSKALRKSIHSLLENNTTAIFINQTRMNIGRVVSETTPGGNALKFHATQRIRIREAAKIRSGDEIVGVDVEANIKKNKVAPPFRTAIMPLLFGEGFSTELALLDAAAERKIIERKGPWMNYKEKSLGQGRLNALKTLKQDPELKKELYQKLKELRLEKKS